MTESEVLIKLICLFKTYFIYFTNILKILEVVSVYGDTDEDIKKVTIDTFYLYNLEAFESNLRIFSFENANILS